MLAGGCSAKIHTRAPNHTKMHDGSGRDVGILRSEETRRISGVIVSSTSNSLTVDTDYVERLTIQRDTIVDIDHPGDELAIAGAILFGLGAIVGVAGMATSSTGGGSYNGFVGAVAGGAGFSLAGVGVTLGIPGWVIWSRSTAAAAEPSAP